MELHSENKLHKYLNSTQYLSFSNTKKAPDFSSTVYLDWSALNARPLVASSNKPRANCQLGDFEAPLKAPGRPMMCSLYLPKSKARISKHSEEELVPAVKARRINGGYSNAIKREREVEAVQHVSVHRRVNTAGSKRVFNVRVAPPFPVLRVKANIQSRREVRPYTGYPERKEFSADKIVEEIPKKRVGTAQLSKGQQRSFRISTPQSLGQRRPDSRYNKATLYARLEYRRTNSPEYRVPVLDMKYSEVSKQQVIPECWK